jgi:hypothetical protein
MGLSLQVFVHDSKMEFSTPRIHGYTYFYHLDPGATIFLRSQNFYFFVPTTGIMILHMVKNHGRDVHH